MNPPSALHGAMSRDRKPFTYTPGGLDLSEIKSERMAKRLMRNAMNQGVPEVPVQSAHSQSNTSAPVALPNFNCLPVQVFPTFNLPANPKSLLRTRSDLRDTPIQRVVPPSVNNARIDNNDTFNNNNKYTPTYSQVNNNRPVSMYEYNPPPASVNTYNLPRTNYGDDAYMTPVLPEISYEAEYFCAPPRVYSATEQLPKLEISDEKDKLPKNESVDTSLDLTIKPLAEVTISTITPTPVVTKSVEENAGTENEQREVKVVKKQVKKENKVEEQNGNQNGDENVEAEMTVKLPTKKSAAKTETKVEVTKKTRPDGSVEEVKTTITKTTIDGKTETKTKTETTIIPKEEESEEEVVEEEEEEEEGEVDEVQEKQEKVGEPKATTVTTTIAAPKENKQETKVVKTEERSESQTTTTKKVVVVQDSPKEKQSVEVEEQEEEEEEEEEEVEEEVVEKAEPVTVVLKKQATPEPTSPVVEKEEVEEEVEEEPEVEQKAAPEEAKKEVEAEEEEDDEEEEVVEVKKEEVKAPPPKDDEEAEEIEEEEEEYEEAEEKKETKVEIKQETEVNESEEEKEEEQVKTVEEEVKQKKEAVSEEPVEVSKEAPKKPEEKVIKVEILPPEEPKPEPKEEKPEPVPQKEYNIPIREPSIPLDKVEDVEIKPIGSSPIISKTHTENTEIIRSTIDPKGGLSTQTEYNKIENIVTVNRTTKILDHNYENLTQQGIPTVRTYFPPPSIDKISTSPLPSRPYQPVYSSEPTTERRHSLLLERLSVERQMPSDIYQYGNQSYDQSQCSNEPRAEVLTVSNVKPSSITSDQQWYQQKNQQNLIYNNVSSTPTPTSQPWAQPKSQPQPQQQYQPQPTYQAQPQQQYQPPSQQHQYQPSSTSQPQYQKSSTPQPQYQPSPTPQPQYQPSPTPQPQYQHSFSEPAPERAPSSYSTFTPTWATNTESQQNTTQSSQYSYLNKETSDSYQRSTQQYSSSYVPPPWEQDTSYTSVNNTSQVYYAPAPQTQTQNQTFAPAPTPGWKPPPAKFSKNTPIAYIPPAPNQSFVRSASISEPPRIPGRKTYYSEYERRYITVPESTYIPTETKYQPQPDPSPQYYYDNNESSEEVEPQWRRELREFTEKTSQTTTTEQTSVQPPWEADAKSAKNPSVAYNTSTPTPTWSQTLKPRSWRERSFESEYVSQEWPKTNTLGRSRPLSTLTKSVDAKIPERTRGVSVDRYNPNYYQSPAEHPPVQAHTLTTPAPHAYHNPNVPAYHARASAEPREQPTPYQQRVYRESRASPLQSRSFKYLQWITGTEN